MWQGNPWDLYLVLLLLYMSALSLSATIRKGVSANEFECCSLDSPVCNNENTVSTSRWLKDDKEYSEIQGSLLILHEIQEEGLWKCALKFVSGHVTDWSNTAEVFLTTNLHSRSEPQKIIVNARLKRLWYQHKFNIGKLSLEKKILSIGLYIMGDNNSRNLLAQRLDSNYSLSERISYNGTSILLSNFSVKLNWEKVQGSYINNTLSVGLKIRLQDTSSSITSIVVITLDCTRKEAQGINTFLLTFTKKKCSDKDPQEIKCLLTNTCLGLDFNMTMLCNNTNRQSGIIRIFSQFTIQLESVQTALQTIAKVSSYDPLHINGSFTKGTMSTSATSESLELNGAMSSTATTSNDIRMNFTGSVEKWFISVLFFLSYIILIITLLLFLFIRRAFWNQKKETSAMSRMREGSSAPPRDSSQLSEQVEGDGQQEPLLSDEDNLKKKITLTKRFNFLPNALNKLTKCFSCWPKKQTVHYSSLLNAVDGEVDAANI